MISRMVFGGWGDPARRSGLPVAAQRWLAHRIGRGTPTRPVALRDVSLPPSRLSPQARGALAAAVGAEHVDESVAARALHAAGKSYLDLVRTRRGELPEAPDAVVAPGSSAEVGAVLQACVETGTAVVPFGGGTSVVGGVGGHTGRWDAAVSLDLSRLDQLVSLDRTSLTATFQAGITGPAAEALLGEHDLALGHLPQSFEHATLGGYAATRSAGQASTGHGRFDDLVVGVALQTPAGPWRLGRGAASAAGPDLLGLVLGSEGAFGVITEVTVRVRPRAQAARYEGVFVRDWSEGLRLVRELEQAGVAPDVVRLSDPDETEVQLALASSGGLKGRAARLALRARGYRPGCLLVLGWEGTPEQVSRRRSAALPLVRAARALRVGRGVGEHWRAGRFDGPYLRDDLLDAGVLVETLETSASWSDLPRVHAAVRAALHASLLATPPLVLCHVSHLYPHGASLYFTVLARQDPVDPVTQWQRAKAAASRAIVDTGATITHHHAVGRDHLPWMEDEVGTLGVAVLRAVKAVLDPTGVLNPGVLVPEE